MPLAVALLRVVSLALATLRVVSQNMRVVQRRHFCFCLPLIFLRLQLELQTQAKHSGGNNLLEEEQHEAV